MGKTGSVQWTQVKGVNGQIRLVPASEAEIKKPGPNQRYKASASISKMSQRGQDSRQDSRGGRGGRGGRGRGGRSGATVDVRVRRAIRRSKVSIMGAKQKSR